MGRCGPAGIGLLSYRLRGRGVLCLLGFHDVTKRVRHQQSLQSLPLALQWLLQPPSKPRSPYGGTIAVRTIAVGSCAVPMTLFLAGVLRVSTVVTTDAWVVALLRVLGLACSEDVHALQAESVQVLARMCMHCRQWGSRSSFLYARSFLPAT